MGQQYPNIAVLQDPKIAGLLRIARLIVVKRALEAKSHIFTFYHSTDGHRKGILNSDTVFNATLDQIIAVQPALIGNDL